MNSEQAVLGREYLETKWSEPPEKYLPLDSHYKEKLGIIDRV